jgi:hypothetical protein
MNVNCISFHTTRVCTVLCTIHPIGPQSSQVCTARCAIIYSANLQRLEYAVAQLAEALRCKSEGRGFDSRLEFFIDIILPAALWP